MGRGALGAADHAAGRRPARGSAPGRVHRPSARGAGRAELAGPSPSPKGTAYTVPINTQNEPVEARPQGWTPLVYSAVSAACSVIFTLAAVLDHAVLIGISPLYFAAKAISNKEPLGVAALGFAVVCALFSISRLMHAV